MNNAMLKAYLWSLVYKYRLYFVSLAIIAISGGLLNVFLQYQIKEIIDAIALNQGSDIATPVFLFALYHLMCHGIYFIQRLFDIRYKPQMLAEIVEDSYRKTMRHALHWFDSHLSGEISSKIIDLQDSILTLITVLARSLGIFANMMISIIFLLTVNYVTVVTLIIFAMIYVPILYILLKKQLKLQQSYVKARQESVGIINDSIANVFGIKIIGNLLTEFRLKLLPSITKWKNWDIKTRKYDAYYVDAADTILTTIMMAAQIAIIAYLYKIGQITVGTFTFVSMITLNVHEDLSDLLENILFSVNPKFATIKSSYEFIENGIDLEISRGAKILESINGDIKYENVTFCYKDGIRIFDNLTLHIKPGERIGIVGRSGSGKTTLIKCLLRYFDPESGAIFVDGHNVKDVTEESLRSHISIIPQDVRMLHRSILDNLKLAKYDASFDEIQSACKKARIHEDIEKMPNGYDSLVGEGGVKISVGQRQRVAIARAILKNTPVLILDEATSALDSPTEELIKQSINEILENTTTTVICIAHRLSTLLHMDRIIVLDKGKIVEAGRHEELLNRSGLYKKLWDAQIGGFLPDL